MGGCRITAKLNGYCPSSPPGLPKRQRLRPAASMTAFPDLEDASTFLPKSSAQFHVQILNLCLAVRQILVNRLVNRQLSGTHPWQKCECKKSEMRARCFQLSLNDPSHWTQSLMKFWRSHTLQHRFYRIGNAPQFGRPCTFTPIQDSVCGPQISIKRETD